MSELLRAHVRPSWTSSSFREQLPRLAQYDKPPASLKTASITSAGSSGSMLYTCPARRVGSWISCCTARASSNMAVTIASKISGLLPKLGMTNSIVTQLDLALSWLVYIGRPSRGSHDFLSEALWGPAASAGLETNCDGKAFANERPQKKPV